MKQTFLTVLVKLFLLTFCYGQRNNMKPVKELIVTQESGWELIEQWKSTATNKIEFLPRDSQRADSSLFQMQLTTSSPIAAMVYGCGGVLVDNGWIRILGSGCNQINRSLPEWNNGKSNFLKGDGSSFLLVADDALGGFFAVNTGGINEYDIGKVFYFGPNNLKWVTTGLGYNEFIVFCFSGDLEKFYKGFRWKSWQNDVGKLSTNEVISCYPLLWTDAGVGLESNRKVVPVQKQWEMYQVSDQKKVIAKKSPKKKAAKRKV